MKTLAKHLLTGLLSAACGALIMRQIMWQEIWAHVIPFDRSAHDSLIDLAIFEPYFNLEIQGTNQVFRSSSYQNRRPIAENLQKSDHTLGWVYKNGFINRILQSRCFHFTGRQNIPDFS